MEGCSPIEFLILLVNFSFARVFLVENGVVVDISEMGLPPVVVVLHNWEFGSFKSTMSEDSAKVVVPWACMASGSLLDTG